MKEWERKQIEQNRGDLIEKTRVTHLVVARMSQKDFLTHDNCEELEACKTKTEKSAAFYRMLLENDDEGSYEHLIDTLVKEKQLPAANILKAGIPKS